MHTISYLRDVKNAGVRGTLVRSQLGDRSRVLVLTLDTLFDSDVLQFAGFEHLAALQTLDKFGIFVAAHKLHARVLAREVGRLRRRLCAHKSGRRPRQNGKGIDSREFPGILAVL
jgi:hypothetical protein